MSDAQPILWHIAISHYSEKARWALDHKRVPHRRRAVPIPGIHIPASMLLTRGASQTFPVLELDGRAIGDSSEIIAALEQRHPEPPLYPTDPVQRRRALALEDFFDEELGPHIRLLAFHELGKDPERFEALVKRTVPAPVARLGGGAATYARTYAGLRFGVRDEEAAALARTKVGDSFGVADLSAAALFNPLVMPDDGPLPSNLELPAGLEAFRAPLRERRGYRWVEETYRRHRQPAGVLATTA